MRAIRDTAFATVGEDGLPSVRIIDVMGTDGKRLYFFTPRGKAFHEDVVREGEYFDLGQKPIFRKSFTLGEGVVQKEGIYFIGDSCIRCGSCERSCPEECIFEGSPFSIDQEHCIRCGICQEVCPADAVEKC